MTDRGYIYCPGSGEGGCGKAGCTYRTIHSRDLKNHTKEIIQKKQECICPHCGKNVGNKVRRHIENNHKDKNADDTVRTYMLPPPIAEGDPAAWCYVKRKVYTCIATDVKKSGKGRWRAEDEATLEKINTPEEKHRIATALFEAWLRIGDYDQGGGYVKGRICLRKYSVLALSPDRKLDNRIHFIDGGLSNINLVVLGVNTAVGFIGKHGSNAAEVVRQRAARAYSEEERQAVMELACGTTAYRHASTNNARLKNGQFKRVHNPAWQSCYSHWRKKFPSDEDKNRMPFDVYWDKAKKLLERQRGLCKISKILMLWDFADGGDRTFAPSFDEVDGVTRWVCRLWNCTDMSSLKEFDDDEPHAWTFDLWERYYYGEKKDEEKLPKRKTASGAGRQNKRGRK